jgi:hypothetical protein
MVMDKPLGSIQEGILDMRSHFRVSIILVASLFISTMAAVAQTGEFAATVPGAVVHAGYALQDEWQAARNRALASEAIGALQKSKPRHVESQQAMRSRRNK